MGRTIDNFKPIEIQDKKVFTDILGEDPPVISEMTFTNLFTWRHYYNPKWRIADDSLLIVMEPGGTAPFGLQPVGPGDKGRALDVLFDDLEQFVSGPKVRRVAEDFVDNYVNSDRYQIQFDPDNSDYVYLSQDLISLSGKKYHRKKNHLNKFLKTYEFEYGALDVELVECFLDMQETWCQLKKCEEDPGLLMEDYAIYQALTHLDELDFQGGAILIDSKIEAFTLGEPLNQDTAVIHIEKANPDIPGLYAAINQLFCTTAWSHMIYVNREQDLGIEGLRTAKQSYSPHHMVNKYFVTRK
ncbi:MAG: DUF2156 domain-containing protein [Desulfobacteraceae bacterium]|nr:DUF2156 domain-containing protein [Desulfobacteraceae bacterium]